MSILIVGAGPVGLTLAAELTRHGVKPRIIDQNAARSDKSKALVLWPRTLELLQKAGVVERFLEAGIRTHGMSVHNEQKQRIAHITFDELRSPYNYILSIPQTETERVLEEVLSDLGVQVERNLRLTGLEQDGSKVRARLGDEVVEVDWLAACDGAHSDCRHALGVHLEGKTVPEEFAMADVEVRNFDPHDEVWAYFHREGVMAFFPLKPPRYRVMASRHAVGTGDRPEAPTLEEIQRYIDERGPVGAKAVDPHWLAAFRVNERHAAEYKHGRVFLVGDAAHCHSPVGGQGMNTGMQDAFNLAWKLALVMNGQASEEPLLSSYSAERQPVGAQVVDQTSVARRVITLRHPVAQEIRNRVMGFMTSLEIVQQRIREQASELAIKYPKSPLNRDVHHGHAGWLLGGGVHPGERAPDGRLVSVEGEESTLFEQAQGESFCLLLLGGQQGEALQDIASWAESAYPGLVKALRVDNSSRWRDPDGSLHRTYGASEPSLYLIRPDGYVGLRAQPASRTELERYLELLGLRALSSPANLSS